MRRILSLAVCIMTCVALVAGCSTGAADTTAPTATTAAAATAAAAATTASAATTAAGATAVATPGPADGPLSKYADPVTVKMAIKLHPANVFPAGDSQSSNVWTRAWKDELNIVLDPVWEANGDDPVGSPYEQRMNIAIASHELPDIMNLTNYSQYQTLLNAGLIEDLTPYYDQYASPSLKKNVTADGGTALSWFTVDGKLMGFPNDGVNYMTARQIWIRHDWFVETGLPVPKTLEDVLAIAKAMKAKDPNRIPIALDKTVEGDTFCDIQGIANSVGAYPRIWLDDGKGNLVYGSIQPAMKNVLSIYADLYKNGIVDQGFASVDGNMVAQQATSNKIGIFYGGFWIPGWPLNTLWDSDGVEWDGYPLLPAADQNGKLLAQVDTPAGNPVVVRKGYDHPEVLLKILSFTVAKIFDPATQEMTKFHDDPAHPDYAYHMFNPLYIMWGPPMTNYDTQKNITKAIDTKDESVLVQPQDKQLYPSVKKYFDDVAAKTKPKGDDWASYKTWYGPTSGFGVLNGYFAGNNFLINKVVGYQSPTMTSQWTSMLQFEAQSVTEFISGIKPMDDFDKFISDWNSMGGATITQEVNDWYKTQTK